MNNGTSPKCTADAACPWPAERDDQCVHHWRMANDPAYQVGQMRRTEGDTPVRPLRSPVRNVLPPLTAADMSPNDQQRAIVKGLLKQIAALRQSAAQRKRYEANLLHTGVNGVKRVQRLLQGYCGYREGGGPRIGRDSCKEDRACFKCRRCKAHCQCERAA